MDRPKCIVDEGGANSGRLAHVHENCSEGCLLKKYVGRYLAMVKRLFSAFLIAEEMLLRTRLSKYHPVRLQGDL